jgi:cytochrome c biogenesis protein CcmG/thiol:disulfide interchange protein DsbE
VTRSLKLTGQVAALVLVAGLLALLVWKLTHQKHAPKIGAPAPVFVARRVDTPGKLDLASLRGKPVVLNFWASWCVSCKDEHRYLLEAAKDYGPQGVAFVGVAFKDSTSDLRSFLHEYGGGWPTVQDPGQDTAINYGVAGPPETFFIDRHGIVRFKVTGPLTPSVLTTQLDRLVGTS